MHVRIFWCNEAESKYILFPHFSVKYQVLMFYLCRKGQPERKVASVEQPEGMSANMHLQWMSILLVHGANLSLSVHDKS